MNTRPGLVVRLTHTGGWLLCLNLACGADYLTPSDVVLPLESSSQEALDQSAGKASLRFLGRDLFPHAAITTLYNDNLLISAITLNLSGTTTLRLTMAGTPDQDNDKLAINYILFVPATVTIHLL